MAAIVDSAFGMGSTHIVCQDFARVSMNPANVYGIIADGCSSSPDTDTGARFLTLAAEQYFQTFPNDDVDVRYITGQAFQAVRMFKMHAHSVDATMLCVRVRQEEGSIIAKATVIGDGYVVARVRENQSLVIFEIKFPSGFPFYGSYLLQKGRYESLLKEGEHGLQRIVNKSVVAKDGTWEADDLPFMESRGSGTPISVAWDFPAATYDIVCVYSDGVDSFFDTSNDGRVQVPYQKVLGELSSYRGLVGQFVQRRFARYLKDAAKRSWVHDDDISVATVYMENDVEENVYVDA